MATVPEATDVLVQLGFPDQQRNERSALVLLALLDLTPGKSWSEAGSPLRGVTQLMGLIAEHFGREYAPNTRETVRRETLHQFLAADLIAKNPDRPDRPVNSPKTVYQINAFALDLLRQYGADHWDQELRSYNQRIGTLRQRWAQERRLRRIPVLLPGGVTLSLSPGGHSVLIGRVINDFCSRWTPGGRLLYVGDTEDKFAYFDSESFLRLGVTVDVHGKMPDLVVHVPDRNWLVLIEAVTSHGPVDVKRHNELRELFYKTAANLVFVTAFHDRRTMAKFAARISWETEVWVADSPSHLVHFDGERFLGADGLGGLAG